MRKLEVTPHDPKWRDEFDIESKAIADALGDNVVTIHHIGSTAIPNIYAKPIIDLLVEVKDLIKLDEQSSSMESLGYEGMGEFGISGRRYFRKDNQEGVRTHHIHIFKLGSEQVKRHLAFRDYMIAHPEDAQRYSELKCSLVKEYSMNMDGYMDGKDGFIKEMDERAAQWLTRQIVQPPATMDENDKMAILILGIPIAGLIYCGLGIVTMMSSPWLRDHALLAGGIFTLVPFVSFATFWTRSAARFYREKDAQKNESFQLKHSQPESPQPEPPKPEHLRPDRHL